MPPTRFVIHFGMPKTGSTAIQDTLAAGEDFLTERGVLYPRTARRGTAHHRIAWSASLERVPREDEQPLAQVLERMGDEIRSADPDTVVVSTEALFHTPARELRPFIEFCDATARSVAAVVYVRAPWEYHEGWYRQRIKTSDYAATFEEHLADVPVVDTRRRLADIEAAVGPDRVEVRPYLRERLREGDVVSDFAEASGLRHLPPAAGHSNPSLDAFATQVKRRLNAEGVPHDARVSAALATTGDRRDHSLFTRAAWEAFQAENAAIISSLAGRPGFPDDFGRRQPGSFAAPLSEEEYQAALAEVRRRRPGWRAQRPSR